MHAASRHETRSLTYLPKDGGVSCLGRLSGRSPIQLWRVRVQVELGPNNNYNLFSSDLCDVRSKTESFYKVY